MDRLPPAGVVRAADRPARYHSWRYWKDRAARRSLAVGGIAVLCAVSLILFYLAWFVIPMFLPAKLSLAATVRPDLPGKPVMLAIEEQREIGFRVSNTSRVAFFDVNSGHVVMEAPLPLVAGDRPRLAARHADGRGIVAVATDTGRVLVVRHDYEVYFSGGVETREIRPTFEYPFGPDAILETGSTQLSALALNGDDDGMLVAAADQRGHIWFSRLTGTENFLTGETTFERETWREEAAFPVTAMTISGDRSRVYVADDRGRIHPYDVGGRHFHEAVETCGAPINAMAMLVGSYSVLTADAAGHVHQYFPVRDDAGWRLQAIREFPGLGATIGSIIPEQRRKGFVALASDGSVGLYNSTAGRLVAQQRTGSKAPLAAALAPRANALLTERSNGMIEMFTIRNPHPEVSLSALWAKVWYEKYDEPEFVWQSSASTSEFEPKFSLVPLVFGTLKAAVYAMLVAVPLALMGAVYSAYLMAPKLRAWLKPGIEMMAALPTVILGFLAGLWFAPLVEEHLAGFFLLPLLLVGGVLLFAVVHSALADRFGWTAHGGWEPVLLVPLLILIVAIAFWLDGPAQAVFFEGDMTVWLENQWGISYDQRNALVVGTAMGFAVIPIIFSMAEDAIYGVPRSLSNSSLALGATRWQTLFRVVLPTASPGIFAALMIGMGRAVGETMIILMATGNTPILDWNVFEGMRTLAANIAIEMPESELNSTHYRILFLSALVLFAVTFVLNTLAEVIRQRLRRRYSRL